MSGGDKGSRKDQDDGAYGEGALDFIYEHTKEGPNLQFHDSEQLDTKILAVLAAATVAIGTASRLPMAEGPLMLWVEASFYLAAAAWAVVVGVTLWHLRPKGHRRAVRADVFSREKYRQETAEKLKRRAVADIRQSYEDNKVVLDAKAKTFLWAAVFTAVEGFFLVLALGLARAAG